MNVFKLFALVILLRVSVDGAFESEMLAASRTGNIEHAKLLYKLAKESGDSIDLHYKTQWHNCAEETLLQASLLTGHIDFAKWLSQQTLYDIHFCDDYVLREIFAAGTRDITTYGVRDLETVKQFIQLLQDHYGIAFDRPVYMKYIYESFHRNLKNGEYDVARYLQTIVPLEKDELKAHCQDAFQDRIHYNGEYFHKAREIYDFCENAGLNIDIHRNHDEPLRKAVRQVSLQAVNFLMEIADQKQQPYMIPYFEYMEAIHYCDANRFHLCPDISRVTIKIMFHTNMLSDYFFYRDTHLLHLLDPNLMEIDLNNYEPKAYVDKLTTFLGIVANITDYSDESLIAATKSRSHRLIRWIIGIHKAETVTKSTLDICVKNAMDRSDAMILKLVLQFAEKHGMTYHALIRKELIDQVYALNYERPHRTCGYILKETMHTFNFESPSYYLIDYAYTNDSYQEVVNTTFLSQISEYFYPTDLPTISNKLYEMHIRSAYIPFTAIKIATITKKHNYLSENFWKSALSSALANGYVAEAEYLLA